MTVIHIKMFINGGFLRLLLDGGDRVDGEIQNSDVNRSTNIREEELQGQKL